MDSDGRLKMFSFNASSFCLDEKAEEFFREHKAISSDFGSVVYVDSERAAGLFASLIANGVGSQFQTRSMESRLRELESQTTVLADRKDALEKENGLLIEKLTQSHNELAALSTLVQENAATIEALRNEVSVQRGRAVSDSVKGLSPQVPSVTSDSAMRLRSELQALRIQHADAISSLKVLESENKELYKELELLRKQSLAVPKGLS